MTNKKQLILAIVVILITTSTGLYLQHINAPTYGLAGWVENLLS